jgi:hypothetical protein
MCHVGASIARLGCQKTKVTPIDIPKAQLAPEMLN